MSSCIIFCAGGFENLAEPIQETDYVIAADGGYRHTQALNITPDAILGDFDSLEKIPEGATVFPVEKDDTDAMLAVRHGLSKGCKRFVLYGALDGPRLDHTVANLQALLFLADKGAEGYLVGNTQIATTVTSTQAFPETATGIISVFCLGKDARGVTIKGLKYPLENGDLTAAFPLGVSNHFTGKPARISVEDGTLLIIYDRQNGIL